MSDMILFSVSKLVAISIYLALILITLRRRGFRDSLTKSLLFYLGFSLVFDIGYLIKASEIPFVLPFFVITNMRHLALMILAFILFHLSTKFTHQRFGWLWWFFVIIELLGFLFLIIFHKQIPDLENIIPWWNFEIGDSLIFYFLFGWGIFMTAAIFRVYKAVKNERHQTMRPRLRLWLFNIVIVLLGHNLIIVGQYLWGGVCLLFGSIVLTLLINSARVPDIKRSFQQLLIKLFLVMIELGIYSLGIFAILHLVGNLSGFQPALFSLFVSCIFIVLLNPISNQIMKQLKRLFYGVDVNSSEMLREHSRQISSAMDLELLSKVVVDLVEDWIKVDRGSLYTVDLEMSEKGNRRYRIYEVPGQDGEETPSGLIPIDSPLAIKFVEQKSSLTIAEIKTMPIYLGLLGDERVWLERQKMDLFIPIHSKDEWIGLLAIGPKRTGSLFTRDDIILLETLVDQTAVALQNARLVNSLVRVNNEFRRAYSAMDEAHKKLERLNRTKSDFISISSHELRTPLTVLSGYTQILLEDSIIVENEYYKKVILGIYEGTNRLHEIVDSMVEVAKIDTRELELQSKPINLSQVIQQTLGSFDDVASGRNLEIMIDSIDNLPPVIGDEDALSKVFYHLLSNAVKYTPDGGKVVISGSALERGDPKFQSGGVEIIISDTGIGIDPRYIDLIFTKFYQTGELALHSSGKTKFKGGGPGLGLAIVRGIVQAHGGLVWAESPEYDEVNCPGSDFHIILPTYLNTA